MILLGRSPFYKGQKIAPFTCKVLSLGLSRLLQMADKRSILAINSIFLALASLVASSLIFHVASPFPHFAESSGFPLSTTGSSPSKSFREMTTLLSSDGSVLCSNDLVSTERRKYSPGLYLLEAITDFHGDQTVIRSHKS